MNRRTFVVNSVLATALPYYLGTLSACSLNTTRRRPVFVMVQLIGGNDGLNTLIPLNQYAKLSKARGNLLIPENKVLGLSGVSDTGLHPAMKGIQDLYNNKLASFIQGVGYENPNYSHFRASDIMLTGSGASETLYTGWMARYLETRFKNYPHGFPNEAHLAPPAIKVGDTGSFLFEGYKMDMSIVIDPYKRLETPKVDLTASNDDTYAAQEVKSIREILLQTKSYSEIIEKALQRNFVHSKLYPKPGQNSLADQLKRVSQLINYDLETSVYLVDLNGFDMHNAQADIADPTKGIHADLLQKVSEAITCFWDDIQSMGRENDVTGMVFSEFGRRIKSNASTGTDHGSSQPFLLFGANLRCGIIGKNPEIPDVVQASDNLPTQYDYRSVYASILANWAHVPASEIKSILKGDFEQIQIFK